MGKDSFVIVREQRPAFESLSDEDAGRLVKAVLAYQFDGIEPDLPPVPQMAFAMMRPVFERFAAKYEETCRKRREAGAKGGKAKAAKASKCQTDQANVANASNAKQSLHDRDPDRDPDREEKRENTYSPAGAGQRTQTAPKPRRNSVLSGKRLETFERFWDAFDHKQGRGGAEKAWAAIPVLTDSLVEQICEAARKEAARRPAWVAKGMTPKMAQGWLNERRWEDDYSQPEQQARRPYVPQGRPGQFAGMTWGEIRSEKNKQACLDATREYLAEKGIVLEEEEYEQPGDEPWTVTVNE